MSNQLRRRTLLKGTAVGTSLGGFFVYALLAAFIIGMKANSGDGDDIVHLGDLFVTFLLGGAGAAIASTGVLFIQDRLTQTPSQQPAPQPAD